MTNSNLKIPKASIVAKNVINVQRQTEIIKNTDQLHNLTKTKYFYANIVGFNINQLAEIKSIALKNVWAFLKRNTFQYHNA